MGEVGGVGGRRRGEGEEGSVRGEEGRGGRLLG